MKSNFNNYKDKWRTETVPLSSLTAITTNENYLKIIELGNSNEYAKKYILGFIIDDLEKNKGFWFAALRKLTGVNPVPETNTGKITDIANYWLEWAKENTYWVN